MTAREMILENKKMKMLDVHDAKEFNLHSSLIILIKSNIGFTTKNFVHYIVGDFDYWPSTGLFISRTTKKRGRGIKNLLKQVKRIDAMLNELNR